MLKKGFNDCSFLLMVLIALSALIFPDFCIAKDHLIPKERALKIAQNEATTLGFNLSEKIEMAEMYTYAWNPYLPSKQEVIGMLESSELVAGEIEELKRLNKLLSKLKDKTYWLVNFSPKLLSNKVTMDGVIFVYIDAKTGKVFDVFQ